ncbi:acyl carrier protein [Pseudomonas sp. LS1212]|uniref:acyl carrier protein n=1 Tax=Pseudomonas sp. LS1212 TaxID=2972478 RepID=UPI00215CFB2F|nr:phosphopantetheine-binding protein [Pseudomonas sp. LS1212]UVJ45310.1 acyl carrier protein [Pseudomonas sp. LS1212]
MNRSRISKTVHDFIATYLGDDHEFDDDVSLQALGLDKKDIEELIFRLEDELGLTAITFQEDELLKRAVTANDLCRFLQQISRQ